MPNYGKKVAPLQETELKEYLEQPYKRVECENLEVKLRTIPPDVVELIRHNQTLVWLSLDQQNISDLSGVSAFLRENAVLKELFLNTNRIRDLSVLAEGLKVNKTLTTLGLGENYITNLEPLAVVLETNNTLKELDLFANRIDDKNALRLFEALRKNSSIKSLAIRDNRMSKELYKQVKPAINAKPRTGGSSTRSSWQSFSGPMLKARASIVAEEELAAKKADM